MHKKKELVTFWFIACFISSIAMYSCQINLNEELESFDTLVCLMVPQQFANGADTVVVTMRDWDGDRVSDEFTVDGFFVKNKFYNTDIDLLHNGSSVISEIRVEAEDHIFYFDWDSSLCAISYYNDFDKDTLPFGSKFTFGACVPSSGDLVISLLHKPTKVYSTHDFYNGETDINKLNGELDFRGIANISIPQ